MPNLTQALRVRKVLYHLRGLPLPVPMTVPEFVMVLLGSALALVMLTAHLVASPVELVVIGGVVGVVVYALRQESVDGKTPGQWVVTALRWISSPAVLVGAHPDLERDLPVRVDSFVVPHAADELRRWTPPPGSAGIAGIATVRGPLIPPAPTRRSGAPAGRGSTSDRTGFRGRSGPSETDIPITQTTPTPEDGDRARGSGLAAAYTAPRRRGPARQ